MVDIQCPKCGKNHSVSDENLGKKAKCSACGHIFVLEQTKQEEGGNNVLEFSEEPREVTTTTETPTESEAVVNEPEEPENKIQIEKMGERNIKPHKWSFLLFSSPGFFLLFVLFCVSLPIGIFSPYILFVSLGLFVLLGISFFLNLIRYKKENYTFTDTKLIYEYGTLFSDDSVEVRIDKITQVGEVLPFIQHLLFKTGTLYIKTAGSSKSSIVLKSVSHTTELYEELQKRMQQNGFHLQKDKLVQEAKPHWLGIIGEIFGISIGTVIYFIYLLPGIVAGIQNLEFQGAGMLTGIATGVGVLIFLGFATLRFLDLKRRKYDVYTDSIFYTEGFLTKHYSFLPMEKVSDSENTQSFFSKIFGLHDIIVSSEGSSTRVLFKNMTEGEQMMKNIKYLKNNINMTKNELLSNKSSQSDSLIGFKDTTEAPLDYDKEFTADYKMDMMRTIIGTLPLIITMWMYIFVLIYSVIRVKFTNYRVDNSSIESKYKFLRQEYASFSVEKITGVIIKENLLDKLMKTCSITFWSIGSNKNITFRNLKKTPELEKNILAKVAINQGETAKNLQVDFGFGNYIKANIAAFIALCFLALMVGAFLTIGAMSEADPQMLENIFTLAYVAPILLVVFFALNFVYKKVFYSEKFYTQQLTEDYFFSKQGIIFQSKKYSLFRNIKGISAVKYPLTNTGKLVANIGGEQMIQDKKKKAVSILSNTIRANYIANVFEVQTLFDTLLKGKELDRSVIKEEGQDIGNSIVFLVIFALLLGGASFFVHPALGVGILGVFLLIIGLIVWYIQLKKYVLEQQRIVSHSGIIYRKRHSILYEKFNYVTKSQGFIGKIFRNGVVSIYTLGSGSVDMKILDNENFREIYDMLKHE